jgi:hypothetical protein
MGIIVLDEGLVLYTADAAFGTRGSRDSWPADFNLPISITFSPVAADPSGFIKLIAEKDTRITLTSSAIQRLCLNINIIYLLFYGTLLLYVTENGSFENFLVDLC